MISSLYRFIGICLLAFPLAGLASEETTQIDKQAIKNQLKALVHTGMTIDEAVAKTITAAPHNGKTITTIALSTYRKLPKTACAIRAKDGGMRFAVWPDFKACGDRIVRAAISAGADPVEVTTASATGLPETNRAAYKPNHLSDRSARKTFGVDMYVLRQIFLGGVN